MAELQHPQSEDKQDASTSATMAETLEVNATQRKKKGFRQTITCAQSCVYLHIVWQECLWYIYHLEVKFSADGKMEEWLERRICITLSMAGALLRNVYGNRELSREANMEAYIAMVTYGCELALREKEKATLQATEMSVLREVAGLTRLDCTRSVKIRQRLQ